MIVGKLDSNLIDEAKLLSSGRCCHLFVRLYKKYIMEKRTIFNYTNRATSPITGLRAIIRIFEVYFTGSSLERRSVNTRVN